MMIFHKLVLGLSVALTTPAAFGAESFQGEAGAIQKYLEELFVQSRNVNAAEAPTQKKARASIENALDWDLVAKEALGAGTWGKTPAANRKAFRDLLKEVILKTAFTRLDTFWDGASYKFSQIAVKDKSAQATAVYLLKGEEFTLDYYLVKQGKSWFISDVALEEIRYSENIREQIKAYLKDNNFEGLLGKLRKRRDELNAGESKSS